ncbi:abortive infection family protein [Pseudoalteromonas shioyasakiensis]|uniref:Abortive infection family protein n=1 Tax=Pseudoalteromonas shioyasakiensis TaxID=1190813 RepID=A0ABT6U5E9_9GAMM|nr:MULTISPECIES: abortive infection family protein [Pseudoalteromonas]MDI4671007.1 abortive infection family protein [Pseudoalteromonas shioyasakiensis]MDI4672282.1 abortive infection family protein [Pseudoalteromonas shioyasakiensis]MDI4687916.1 abortive infection family protein [Pseudoalteromonas shioyasakiensis]MDI4706512.1 abortive infection family protein [Pseudoalteromonas shioyasakiensis]
MLDKLLAFAISYQKIMRKKIPAPVIAVLSDNLHEIESHVGLDNLFTYADAPGEPPVGSKQVKIQAWLRRINKESDFPLKILGKIIEEYMELSDELAQDSYQWGVNITAQKQELKTKLIKVFERCNLTYINGGTVSDGNSAPSKSLLEVIKGRDIPSIEAEFNRALNNVNSAPRDAVSAACNILESIFKVYIEDEKLPFPQKQDLQGVWKVVRDDLGFDTKLVQDDDLKRIISGMLSIVGGIGAFRTHASSAHGEGRKVYNLKPRHARLAIHSAHTLALFVLETWDEKKSKKPKSV